MYIYLSFSHAILFYVSPRLSRTRDPSFSPSFFHNFLLVQRTITVVCALGKEGGSERVDGQTVNVWKIGRRTFDFPTRSASPSFSFALPRTVNSSICAYFFSSSSSLFDPRAEENRLSGNAKEETSDSRRSYRLSKRCCFIAA